MTNFWDSVTAWAQDAFTNTVTDGPHWLWTVVEILLLFLVANMLCRLVSRVIRALMNFRMKRSQPEKQRRMQSISTLTHSVLRYIIYFVAIVISLSLLGLGNNIGSAITAAGVAGIALGIGAQSVIKDVVTGFLLLFENQFHVGEYVEIAGVKGTVQAIALRVTYIRGFRGEVHIVPNGSIDKVVNYSRGSYLAIVDVLITHDEDIEHALSVMREEAAAYAKHSELVTEPPEVLGMVSLNESSITLRLAAKTTAPEHFTIERELSVRLKKRFAEENIEVPYPRRVWLRAAGDKKAERKAQPPAGGEDA